MRKTSQKDATNSNLEDKALNWGKAVSGPRQDLGSLILLFNNSRNPNPSLSISQERKKNPPPFLVRVTNPLAHT